jgi:hypothetical protein
MIVGAEGSPPTRVSITGYDAERGWDIRAAPLEFKSSGTTRFIYAWEHERCRIWNRIEDGSLIPWNFEHRDTLKLGDPDSFDAN